PQTPVQGQQPAQGCLGLVASGQQLGSQQVRSGGITGFLFGTQDQGLGQIRLVQAQAGTGGKQVIEPRIITARCALEQPFRRTLPIAFQPGPQTAPGQTPMPTGKQATPPMANTARRTPDAQQQND